MPRDLSESRTLGARHLEILDGLETIVLTEGFRDLTVGTLAERLRCSRRTLYEIADSKEGLVLLVIDRLMRRLARVAREALLRETTLLDQVRAFLIDGLSELRRATLAFSEDVAAFPEAAQLVAAHFHYARGLFEGLLRQGMQTGEFHKVNPVIAAETFDAALERLLDPQVLRAAKVSFAEALEEYLTLFTDGLRAPIPVPRAGFKSAAATKSNSVRGVS
jgi:AcrR family transcriptional regulator